MQRLDAVWEVSVEDVKPLIDEASAVFLLDVRHPEEFDTARIEGAFLCPLPEIPERIEEIRQAAEGRHIVAYCHHGHRSVQAVAFLREAGLGAARSMQGGIDAWSRRIDPNIPRY
ncbi:MAG: hypothetical protein KDA33_09835 [Phycisphaerales bacterium]|nr:hypothetical protein [Phycisphaerales bacterium]